VKRSGKSDGHNEAAGGENDAKSLQNIRKAHIQSVLELAGGDVEAAAQLLEISVSELRRWMTKLGIA
jgi:transcriptional regulator with PAS, ATPase and Fis domain